LIERGRTFKLAAMTSVCRSLMHMQQHPLAARYPTERVWRHWLTGWATVPDP